jgi:Protein of unknown function (DUF559)
MTTIQDVPFVASRQGGVFTAQQALTEGWTMRQIRRRLTAGRWVFVAGRAMALRPGAPAPGRAGPGRLSGQGGQSQFGGLAAPVWTSFQLAFAAHLTMPGAISSHLTAGVLHGFPLRQDRDPVAHVISHRRHDLVPGIQVHRLRLAAEDTDVHGAGFSITTPSRTALDLLAWMSFAQALDLWAWTSTREVLDVAGLERAISERRRRHGSPRLRALLQVVRSGAASGGEARLHTLLDAAGITGWQAAATVFDDAGVIGVVDVLFPGVRLVIEFDGWRAHSGRGQFVQDRRRQNRLVAAGFTVLRFTWEDLLERPHDVVEQIRRATSRLAA